MYLLFSLSLILKICKHESNVTKTWASANIFLLFTPSSKLTKIKNLRTYYACFVVTVLN